MAAPITVLTPASATPWARPGTPGTAAGDLGDRGRGTPRPTTPPTSPRAAGQTGAATSPPAIPARPAGPAPTATGATVGSWFANDVIAATNRERRVAGCPDLTVDPVLTVVAQAHSVDMAVAGYFSHDGRDGRTPFDRITAAGFAFSVAAENIAAGQRDPDTVLRAWMDSPGHRANILNCLLTRIGVGFATGGSYGTYWTQDFATPVR
jgi:uncharacterized protein YkwD